MQGAIGSSYFLGWCLLCTLLPYLANERGRKPVVVATFTLTSLAILGTLYNDKLVVQLGLSFTMGIFASGRIAVSFIWLMEMLTPKFQALVATASALIYVSFFAIITLYLKYLSKDIKIITYVGIICGILASVGVCFLDESPLWLLRRGKVVKAEFVFRKMFEMNG